MTTFLSKNFTLEELIHTDTGIDNIPEPDHILQLRKLAQTILQPIRDQFGPVVINSGYRSKAVHDFLTAKGYPTSKTSQHLEGEAADIEVPGMPLETVFEWIRKHLDFGQVILEDHSGARWIHVSLLRLGKPNWQALYFKNGTYESA